MPTRKLSTTAHTDNQSGTTLPITRRRQTLHHNQSNFGGRRAWALLDLYFVAHLFFLRCII
jgi:hypothetical protein